MFASTNGASNLATDANGIFPDAFVTMVTNIKAEMYLGQTFQAASKPTGKCTFDGLQKMMKMIGWFVFNLSFFVMIVVNACWMVYNTFKNTQ